MLLNLIKLYKWRISQNILIKAIQEIIQKIKKISIFLIYLLFILFKSLITLKNVNLVTSDGLLKYLLVGNI